MLNVPNCRQKRKNQHNVDLLIGAFWPREEVEEALGADILDVLPELLRLAELEVRIPTIEVVTL